MHTADTFEGGGTGDADCFTDESDCPQPLEEAPHWVGTWKRELLQSVSPLATARHAASSRMLRVMARCEGTLLMVRTWIECASIPIFVKWYVKCIIQSSFREVGMLLTDVFCVRANAHEYEQL